MFKQLYNILKKENLLEQSFDRSSDAMAIIEEMFLKSLLALRENNPDKSYDIFIQDKKINEHERAIRKKSLTHLTVTGQDDLNPALVLITIVHDIERVGDYTKNIYELSEKLGEKLEFGANEAQVKEIENLIIGAFKDLNESFVETSKEESRKLMDTLSSGRKLCEDVIDAILESGNGNPKHNLIGVLYVRFLKRIAAHLNNIATSFVNPFDRIGFEE